MSSDKNNQKHTGVITHSCVCAGLTQTSSSSETGVGNLAQIILPTFITSHGRFDYDRLHSVVKVIVYNLNKLIDVTSFPTREAAYSNELHRPLSICVQGFADALVALQIPFDSKDARDMNVGIAQTIYYASLDSSCDLARKYGAYATFLGSPASRGFLQFDMWDIAPPITYLDWDSLKSDIKVYGLRNSIFVAHTPAIGTTALTGYNEGFDPPTRCIVCLIHISIRLTRCQAIFVFRGFVLEKSR